VLELAAATETHCCHCEESLPAHTHNMPSTPAQLPCKQNSLAFKGTCPNTQIQARVAHLRRVLGNKAPLQEKYKNIAYLFARLFGAAII